MTFYYNPTQYGNTGGGVSLQYLQANYPTNSTVNTEFAAKLNLTGGTLTGPLTGTTLDATTVGGTTATNIGNSSCTGSLSSLVLPNTNGGTLAPLATAANDSINVTFQSTTGNGTGSSTTSTIAVYYSKVGNSVTLQIPAFTITSGTSVTTITISSALPTFLRPAHGGTQSTMCSTRSGASPFVGSCLLTTAGILTITATNQSTFNSNTVIGIFSDLVINFIANN